MFELYFLKTCPFCRKVIEFADNNYIDLNLKNIFVLENKDKLIMLGGKEQVPYLFNTDKNFGLYESDDIIDYLKNEVNYNE